MFDQASQNLFIFTFSKIRGLHGFPHLPPRAETPRVVVRLNLHTHVKIASQSTNSMSKLQLFTRFLRCLDYVAPLGYLFTISGFSIENDIYYIIAAWAESIVVFITGTRHRAIVVFLYGHVVH